MYQTIRDHWHNLPKLKEVIQNYDKTDVFIQAIRHHKGLGVEQNYSKAKDLYEQAAELGNSKALNNLGLLYHYSLGVEKNYTKAKELYEKAAELGNSNALNNLGVLYNNGLGVEKNYTKAKELYEKAAELENSNALNNLGLLYHYGLGVEKNYTKAKELYEQAAELENRGALNNLRKLYQQNAIGLKVISADIKEKKRLQKENAELKQKLLEAELSPFPGRLFLEAQKRFNEHTF
jgi:TPR repeat protein